MDFTLAHDDGQLVHDLEEADIVVVGVSRTSKTPTSLYLANRGYKTANVPLVPGIDRSEEHTSELQSLMRISYAVFCLKKKNVKNTRDNRNRLSDMLRDISHK